jgi:hypothetical protein
MSPGRRGPAKWLFGLFRVLLVLPFTLGKPPPEPSGAAGFEA